MLLPENSRLPRDANSLLREVDAAIKVKDIEITQRWRERVEPQWWESGVIILLFISGLGFIITIYKLLPSQNALLFRFTFFWFLLFVITLIAAVEFLLMKIAAMRKLYEANCRLLERLEKECAKLAEQNAAAESPSSAKTK